MDFTRRTVGQVVLASAVMDDSVGWMIVSIIFSVAAAVSHLPARGPLLAFPVESAVIIAFTHRSNLSRMLAGTEPRARRLWLLGAGRTRR